MNKYRFAAFLCIIFIVALSVKAETKPQWIKNPPTPGNSSYVFRVVKAEGEDLSSARSATLKALVSMIEHDDNIKIKEDHTLIDEAKRSNGNLASSNEKSVYTLEVENSINKTLTTEKVAEYSEDFERNGQMRKRLYTLFMVQCDNSIANFDDVKLTTKYGMRGFLRSMIVPGWGQIYKGSGVKGGLIMGGAAAIAAGIVITENTRADYIKKMHEQPKFATTYNSKATDWETGRNVCIGAAVALYVYNLVDAIAANGAERAIVKKRNNNLSFGPIVNAGECGLSIRYNF